MQQTSGDYVYEVISRKTTIIKYIGNDSNVKIPRTLGGYIVNAIGNKAFEANTKLISVDIPDGVVYIGYQAFYQCTGLQSLKIGEGLASFIILDINQYAFWGCSNLRKINIKCGKINFIDGVFGYCSYLSSIELPEGLINIGRLSFYNCLNLNKIVIPETVEIIGDQAFDGCKGVASITAKSKIAPQTALSAFINIPLTVPVYIPKGASGYYTKPWTNFNIIEI